MGKPTGFMEYPRCENRRRPPLERAADWEDIYVPVEGAQRLEQGARCMNCGVPFCQAAARRASSLRESSSAARCTT